VQSKTVSQNCHENITTLFRLGGEFMAKRIGVLTAGGDVPGQNVCLKALVYLAGDSGFDVVGFRKGWEGLIKYDLGNRTTQTDNVIALSKSRVRDIDRMGGSFLHSSRIDPRQVPEKMVPNFLREDRQGQQPYDLTSHIQTVFAQMQLEALVVLGDNGGLEAAAHLCNQGVPIIGIPKSANNDVNGSHYCLGFSTAMARGVEFVHEVRAMAGSREEIAIIEVLGRTSGWITMLISILSGADRCIIPEVPFDPDRLAALLAEDKRRNPSNYAILTMSQGARVTAGQAVKYAPALSRAAQSSLLTQVTATKAQELGESEDSYSLTDVTELGTDVSGSGAAVTEILETILDQRTIFQPLSYLIRTGKPDGQDLLGAVNFATLAVSLLKEKKLCRLAAYRRGDNYVDLPMDTVNHPETGIPVADLLDMDNYVPKPEVMWAARI